ncbi:MAG: cell division protein FtsZ [Bacteroidia bacterium]|nr:cell division protein FtsZ [Bacteroidia bacterium]
MQFEQTKERPSIIKVIGVGGGGSNAVNHMYKFGIKGVEFIVSNTDEQALETSPVPHKIQLGKSLTDGRGAGSIPEVGRNSALENLDEIKKILGNQTKMLFITAGMGGGTGTGAAPVIAKVAREMNILTVAIVTVPFQFEGKKRKVQAEEGIEELKKYVDTLLIICNDKLREIHGNLKIGEAFAYADNILSVAAKSIAEIISETLHINVDFADVQTVMKDSGVAIMGSAIAEGPNRAVTAVETALDSPLLNDNDIEGARYILLNITSGKDEITMDEMGQINEYVQNKAGQTADIILGMGHDESLGDKISVTIIATGFKSNSQKNKEKPREKVVYDLSGKVKSEVNILPAGNIENPLEPVLKAEQEEIQVTEKPPVSFSDEDIIVKETEDGKVVFSLETTEELIEHEAERIPEEPVLIEREEVWAEEKMVLEPFMEHSTEVMQELPISESKLQIPESPEQVEEPLMEVLEEEITYETVTVTEAPFEFEISLNETEEEKTEEVVAEENESPKAEITPVMVEDEKQVEEIPEVKAEETTVTRKIDEPEGGVIVQIKSSEPDPHAELFDRSRQRILKLKEISMSNLNPRNQAELEKEPAYKRRNIILDESPRQGPTISRLSLGEDENKGTGFKPNGYLHDKAD